MKLFRIMTLVTVLSFVSAQAAAAPPDPVSAEREAVEQPRDSWHPGTVALQSGMGLAVGFLSIFPYLGLSAGYDSAFASDSDTHSAAGLAVSAAIVPVLVPTTVWLVGDLMRGTGSAWATILFGTLAGIAAGVPVSATSGTILSGWLVGEIAALAVSVPVYHLTSDAGGPEEARSFWLAPTGRGVAVGGAF